MNVYLYDRKATVNVYPRTERLLAAVGYKLSKLTVICCEKLASPSRVRTESGHRLPALEPPSLAEWGVLIGLCCLTNTCAKYQQHRETETLRLASGLTSQSMPRSRCYRRLNVVNLGLHTHRPYRPATSSDLLSAQSYHWQELSQVSFLLRQIRVYHWRELPQVPFLSQQNVFVATKHVFCVDKRMLVA